MGGIMAKGGGRSNQNSIAASKLLSNYRSWARIVMTMMISVTPPAHRRAARDGDFHHPVQPISESCRLVNAYSGVSSFVIAQAIEYGNNGRDEIHR
jgi:hypothetical protein